MGRRLLNLLTALSLLLCVASVALFLRGVWVDDGLDVERSRVERHWCHATSCDFFSEAGGVSVTWTSVSFVSHDDPGPEPRWRVSRYSAPRPASVGQWRHFDYVQSAAGAAAGMRVQFPVLLLTLLSGVLPAARLNRRLRPRPTPGHCLRCGYDLRATPDHCPECGTEKSAAIST